MIDQLISELVAYEKTISFCEMVLNKIFSFHKTVCLVFIHGMDAQNILCRIVKGHSGIF